MSFNKNHRHASECWHPALRRVCGAKILLPCGLTALDSGLRRRDGSCHLMRIIAGDWARRPLLAPEGQGTRPTSDRTREALFNILQHQDWGREVLAGATVLDACCGTGALALEALSRGAAQAWLLERDRAALQVAQQNIKTLGAQNCAHLLLADATQPPSAKVSCNLIFLDPPYGKNLPEQIIPALIAQGWFAAEAMLVLETARHETVRLPEAFTLRQERVYGAACLRFYDYALT